MNRARETSETYEEYRATLKMDAKVMKMRLRGRWVWKTFYPIDALTTNFPKGAVAYHRDEDTGDMWPSLELKHDERVEFLKFPPYRKQKHEE